MDRTTKPEHKFNLSNVMEGLNGYIEIDEILNRLSAYEDTELEPSEIAQIQADLATYKQAEADGRCVVLPKKLGDMVMTKYGLGEVVAWDTTARLRINDEPDFVKRYKDFDINSKIFTKPAAEALKGAEV